MVKKEFSNVERRKTLQQPMVSNESIMSECATLLRLQQLMVNNETIMLSECATLLRDIRFGIRFLVKNVVSFSFTLDWFLFLHFFSSTGKKKT